ncbi:MAG: hypothetical protein ABSC11_02060 [Smithella sp.]
MLNEFHKFINSLLPISFTILEEHKSTTFFGKHNSASFWSRKTSHVSYRGGIPVPGFENISVVFNPVKNLPEEYKKFIGYIEIVNSSEEDTIPCPEIRGFIQEDLGIDKIFNEMLIESKMFNSKMSPVYIYLEQSYCLKDKPPEELLKKKIPIREISTFQKISCIE